MHFDFDRIIDRQGSNSIKWHRYDAGVLPLWVADMDFSAPQPVLTALQEMVGHGVLGYEMPTARLAETVAARLLQLYGWQVSPEAVIATPGVVAGFNIAARTVCAPGQGIVVQPPVYPPFLALSGHLGLVRQDAPLAATADGPVLRYSMDFDALERAIDSAGAKTGMFLLCSPHNPTGSVWSRGDLARLAGICLEKDICLVSDEIHCELLPGGVRHIPAASLDPEIARRSVTLIAPSKTFNIPGLFCAFAVIPDRDLRERFKKVLEGMAMHVNSPGLAAAQVAYSGACDDWLAALNAYLRANRDFLVDAVRSRFPGIRTTLPEATYLAWLDCNDLVRDGRIPVSPSEFFLKNARVALNEGREFGPGGEGFVRLNFGCPRSTLAEALDRMQTALS